MTCHEDARCVPPIRVAPWGGCAMTNHYSGPGTVEEIRRISPLLTGLSADPVTTEQDHHPAAGHRADPPEPDFPYQKISDPASPRPDRLPASARPLPDPMPPPDKI